MKLLTFILGIMQTNCYFLIDEETSRAAVIDPACDAKTILEKINSRGLIVSHILLTHGHYDHMMALEELRDAVKAPVCVHRLDAPALTNPDISYMSKFGGVNTACRPAQRLLEDSDTIEIGGLRVKVMHTPGHTLGSVCYIAGDIILTGDTLFRNDIGRYDLYGGDWDQLKNSLARLGGLEGDYRIYPGHGASSRLSYERKNNIYLYAEPPLS